MKTTIPRNSIPSLLLIPLMLACFGLGLSPRAQAVSPTPDGGYLGANTAEGGAGALFSLTTGTNNTAVGSQALFSLTTGQQNTAVGAQALKNNTANDNTADGFQALVKNTAGGDNTATGWRALFQNTTGSSNTAVGSAALNSNTTGESNTAVGRQVLYGNTTGYENTANGSGALFSNTTGAANTATGSRALQNNTTGGNNTANGVAALSNNTTGDANTVTGADALSNNSTGSYNTANGEGALASNITGSYNTAIGEEALVINSVGNRNIAVGFDAGDEITYGSDNIDIGNSGLENGESGAIRIGTAGNQTNAFIAGIYGVTTQFAAVPVLIDSSGQLGTLSSSRRFKKEIKAMDQTSESILALKPVTFHYKSDASGTPQFGLIAEEVAEVNPDLVVRDKNGEIYTVRYDAVNAMLLNEFLKAHRKAQQQEATITQLKKDFGATLAQLTARLDEQAAQIQRVSAQLEASKPVPQVVNNNQ